MTVSAVLLRRFAAAAPRLPGRLREGQQQQRRPPRSPRVFTSGFPIAICHLPFAMPIQPCLGAGVVPCTYKHTVWDHLGPRRKGWA